MKVIFYKSLLKRATNLTPNERILYSFLVSKSIIALQSSFETNGSGKIDMGAIDEELGFSGNRISLISINRTKVANVLNQSRVSIINAINLFRRLNIITSVDDEDLIFVDMQILSGGYFELHGMDVLSGELLLFYSFLLDKSEQYGYCINANRIKISEQFGTHINGNRAGIVERLLQRLYEKELAYRDSNTNLLHIIKID